MNKRHMLITTLSTILIVLGSVLLILGTLPMQNEIKDDKLIVKFIIGKEVIDLHDAEFMPVPEEATHNIIRVGGTSVGKKHSGNFRNTKTGTKYKFYLTGKGEKVYFEIGDKKYLVDDIAR